jgi:hypothetical protein
MKNFAALPAFPCLIVLSALLALDAPAQDTGARRHDGFFLSISPGLAFGSSEADLGGNAGSWDNITFSGPGGILDLKVGGAVAENLLLSADFIGRSVRGPDMETIGGTTELDDDVVLSDGTIGLGLTYYVMPANVFVSGTLGVGAFRLRNVDAEDEDPVDTKAGLSLHAKVGKEWWAARDWGLGVAVGYGFVGAERDEDSDADFNGDYSSHKVYVLFNTTFN